MKLFFVLFFSFIFYWVIPIIYFTYLSSMSFFSYQIWSLFFLSFSISQAFQIDIFFTISSFEIKLVVNWASWLNLVQGFHDFHGQGVCGLTRIDSYFSHYFFKIKLFFSFLSFNIMFFYGWASWYYLICFRTCTLVSLLGQGFYMLTHVGLDRVFLTFLNYIFSLILII